jgi:3-phosphoshikimate 1-carboxyvinyltransferase
LTVEQRQGEALTLPLHVTTADTLDIPPLQSAAGLVKLPGSKSISNRVLLLAGLADGQTQVEGLLAADDTRVMLDALMALGCAVRVSDAGTGSTATVQGLGGQPRVPAAKLFLGNAGTAMRPLTAALAVISTLHGGSFELSGVPRMHERPIGDLVDALRQLGCTIDDLGTPGYPPLCVRGTGRHALNLQQPIRVRGDVSSQFLTALLLAAPLATAQQAVHFEVLGELISKPYIDITLKLLSRFGVHVQRDGWQRFTVPAGSRYQSPGSIAVEGDASGASYFIGLGAIAAAHAPIRIEGLGAASIQGDIHFVEAAQAMGADVQLEPNAMTVRRGTWPLKAITMDCNHIPDAAMTLAVMALYAQGTTRLNNIASWRVKETDRIAAMATELRKLGAVVVEGQDFIQITPPATLAAWRAPTLNTHGVASIHTYDDHRMAMSFSLAAFNPAGVVVRIEDPHCVAKTYPGYFDDFFQLVHAKPSDVPVITVDGPTASGKGTVASRVADSLGYHHLDSGALYRATALSALRKGLDLSDAAQVAALASKLPLTFVQGVPQLAGEDISADLRLEAVGAAASQISALPAVRQALQALQLSFRRAPGLVADGRDMGTVIFPDAGLKIFLTAGSEKRAERRHKQLISKGISANISTLRADLEARDARDKTRSTSPLMPAQDAKLLDNSTQTVDETVAAVLGLWAHRGG